MPCPRQPHRRTARASHPRTTFPQHPYSGAPTAHVLAVKVRTTSLCCWTNAPPTTCPRSPSAEVLASPHAQIRHPRPPLSPLHTLSPLLLISSDVIPFLLPLCTSPRPLNVVIVNTPPVPGLTPSYQTGRQNCPAIHPNTIYNIPTSRLCPIAVSHPCRLLSPPASPASSVE